MLRGFSASTLAEAVLFEAPASLASSRAIPSFSCIVQTCLAFAVSLNVILNKWMARSTFPDRLIDSIIVVTVLVFVGGDTEEEASVFSVVIGVR